MGSIIDITKQKETENNLINAQAVTEELMRKKDEFMSVASHELKTPVTSLKGSLQILQRMTAGWIGKIQWYLSSTKLKNKPVNLLYC
ncbi:histidine kinase dimerization/phospho-acceptor domain-containing protein [Mucilaginibacter rubeus]|uniref:histidine kinase n=1 Tax=Mucilaginibacter rubeus TaxID=2027860 RepID=A0A5C1HYP1_9SPHI|nr:histidine kinase dimerization/phospho-acceptor domain-containing protein [Mucilaginibacter rubeus]QEM09938.1 hypothetical protein DEO27_007845 [Mucilaginibacter rubeus]